MVTSDYNLAELRCISKEIRKDIILSIAEAGSGHTGGSLGLADIFTCLYFNIMKHDCNNPKWLQRDRLILSIGHVAPVLYTTLAHANYFPVEELKTLRKLGSRLQGHPGRDHGLPGLELSAGSLGQGLSVALGMAIAAKLDNQSYNVYCILGDGELQEGSVWEAAMSASHHKLNKLIAIVDRNRLQIDGTTSNVMEIEPLKDKWVSFGWTALECDGNNHSEILETIGNAKQNINKPSVIIANTIMGKGVSSIENNHEWHGKAPAMSQVQNFIDQIENSYELYK
jgi:transketolase